MQKPKSENLRVSTDFLCSIYALALSWWWKKKKKKSPYSFFINGSPYLVKLQQPQEQHYPFLPMCAVVVCVQTMECLPVFGIFNVRKEVGALNCIPVLCKHQNWLEEKSPSSHPGNELSSPPFKKCSQTSSLMALWNWLSVAYQVLFRPPGFLSKCVPWNSSQYCAWICGPTLYQ